jgi:hypothetical protein
MSHSISDPDRGWDTGLADDDWIAIVVCEKNGERPIDWQALSPVQFIRVADMRQAAVAKLAQVQKPKGAGEAFETRIVWPSAAASAAGMVVFASGEKIQVRRESDDRLLTVVLRGKRATLRPLVSEGLKVVPRQALAAVVPVRTSIACPADATAATYLARLNSTALTDRYTAVKALTHFEEEPARTALRSRAADDSEHVYVRLEAASGLARWNDDLGWSIIDDCLSSNYLQARLEAIIVLTEIGGQDSQQRLEQVLRDETQHPEIRAGAAWALGELRTPTVLDALIGAFNATDPLLRVEAARALARVTLLHPREVVDALPGVADASRPGVAWALSQAGTFDVDQLLKNLHDVDTRHWVAYIVGTQEPSRLIEHVEQLRARDAELYFAVTLLWKLTTSWIYQLEMY